MLITDKKALQKFYEKKGCGKGSLRSKKQAEEGFLPHFIAEGSKKISEIIVS